MTNNTRRIIAIISTVVVSLMVAGGGIAKLIKVNKVVEGFTRLGVVDYIQALGATELILLGLFLYPKTMRYGFVMLCAYFGGAIATELSHGQVPLPAIAPLIFISLSMLLRDRNFFRAASTDFINY